MSENNQIAFLRKRLQILEDKVEWLHRYTESQDHDCGGPDPWRDEHETPTSTVAAFYNEPDEKDLVWVCPICRAMDGEEHFGKRKTFCHLFRTRCSNCGHLHFVEFKKPQEKTA